MHLTMIGGLSNYGKAIAHLSASPSSGVNPELKLAIPGNHDVSLDPKWWSDNLLEGEDDDPEESEKARELFQNSEIKWLEEGTHTFILRDGRSFTICARPSTPEFNGYAFSYGEEEDRFNIGKKAVPTEGVDLFLTHGPPKMMNTPDREGLLERYTLDQERDGKHCGCEKLWRAVERVKPLVHCFGHIHEGHGAQMVRWQEGKATVLQDVKVGNDEGARGEKRDDALLVNAAISRGHGQEGLNMAWVVELGLSENKTPERVLRVEGAGTV
ncbi:hypothetical protein QBC35DRAFT_447383 [Podospora australis]|uniref:Calcineurin-like phosphoesterase domain-containing protein n=1 Tax=Podospora australis TaxID=1536484 RepID=A0AAN6X278_9PEZI|nr:hypothetical protein QBC35DRAFT_447383 [Podospora australis]